MQPGEPTVTEPEQFATEQQQAVTGHPLHVAAQHKVHQMMDDAAASARRMTGRMRGSLDRVEERVEHQGEDLLRMARKQPALAVGAAAVAGFGLAAAFGAGQLIAAFGAGYLAYRALRAKESQSGDAE
jgi:hypothetical protein